MIILVLVACVRLISLAATLSLYTSPRLVRLGTGAQRRWRMPPDVAAGDEVWEGGGRRYRTEKVVGNGAFGIVWRAREEGSSEVVAIKKVVLDRRYHNRELEMMRGLDHECVIKLHHSFEKP